MKVVPITVAALLGFVAVTPAEALIGQGIQGRPHSGITARHMYADRHGIPYTGPHRRHHLYGNPNRNHSYGR